MPYHRVGGPVAWLIALVALLGAVVTPAMRPRPASAQQPPLGGPDRPIDAAERAQVIDEVIAAFIERYVFPDIARAVAQAIRERQQQGDYDAITSAEQFAETLTQDLQEITGDKHVRVTLAPQAPQQLRTDDLPAEQRERLRRAAAEQAAKANFGFVEVKILPGNIGYLRVDRFDFPADLPGVRAVIAASTQFLAHTDALIIDVRANGGGNPQVVTLLESYFFDEPTHITDIYTREPGTEGGTTDQVWTNPEVDGPRYGMERPVYVLTSSTTGSAGEALPYELQALGRAVVVGEPTAGAANPGDEVRIGDGFLMFVPRGRVINAVTGTSWEGVGVRPDLQVVAEDALMVAHVTSLEQRLEQATDPREKEMLRCILDVVQSGAFGGGSRPVHRRPHPEQRVDTPRRYAHGRVNRVQGPRLR